MAEIQNGKKINKGQLASIWQLHPHSAGWTSSTPTETLPDSPVTSEFLTALAAIYRAQTPPSSAIVEHAFGSVPLSAWEEFQRQLSRSERLLLLTSVPAFGLPLSKHSQRTPRCLTNASDLRDPRQLLLLPVERTFYLSCVVRPVPAQANKLSGHESRPNRNSYCSEDQMTKCRTFI